jgi:hypothetical protein
MAHCLVSERCGYGGEYADRGESRQVVPFIAHNLS